MISTASPPPLRIPPNRQDTPPAEPAKKFKSLRLALYGSNPGYPTGDGFQRQSQGRTRRHQGQATSADSTTSFIHPWAIRQAHENLRRVADESRHGRCPAPSPAVVLDRV